MRARSGTSWNPVHPLGSRPPCSCSRKFCPRPFRKRDAASPDEHLVARCSLAAAQHENARREPGFRREFGAKADHRLRRGPSQEEAPVQLPRRRENKAPSWAHYRHAPVPDRPSYLNQCLNPGEVSARVRSRPAKSRPHGSFSAEGPSGECRWGRGEGGGNGSIEEVGKTSRWGV